MPPTSFSRRYGSLSLPAHRKAEQSALTDPGNIHRREGRYEQATED